MQQGKRLLDDPAVLAQPGAVFGAAPGDDRRDTHRPNLLAILVVVVGTVGIHRVRPSSRAPAATAYWRDVLDQRHELGDVVAVAAGQRRLQRDAVRFGDQVMCVELFTALHAARRELLVPATVVAEVGYL